MSPQPLASTHVEDSSPVEVSTSSNPARALWLLFADVDPAHRAGQVAATLASAREGRLSLAGLIEARRGDRLVGAAWGQVMPGRTALLFAAQLVEQESESTALRLHDVLERMFLTGDVVLAQSSLSLEHCAADARLRASGFRYAADVCYMASSLSDLAGETPQDPVLDQAELQFETYCEANHARLARIVEQTYRQSLDCPAIDGLRSIDDVLAGHRQTGEFAPRRWMIVRGDRKDVGCLLLADHPAQNQWELVYMGLAPEARGRQWGLAVTRMARRLAAAAGRERLVLAVDAKNAPALAMYRAAQFVAWDQRRVFLKALRRAS